MRAVTRETVKSSSGTPASLSGSEAEEGKVTSFYA